MEITELLRLSVSRKASDLHILPLQPPLLRIDGDLISTDFPKLSPEESRTLVYSIMTEDQKKTFEEQLSLDMALPVPNIGNFRVSTLHQLHGIGAVFRVIPAEVPSFTELALPQVLKPLLGFSQGLILVAGPTGSGKTTSLAAMLDYINATRATHIITIEDPIEYTHHTKKSAITQLQVGRDTPHISDALRASLRQDPDVIMLGELRDLETIRLALTAAETGHLVLSTLHASSAPLSINRIIDIFPAAEKNRVRNLLSETLQAVICQMLIKKTLTGRVAAFEIMLATPAIRHLIRQDMIAHMQTTIQTSGDVGMCTIEQYLHDLVAKRIITSSVARTAIQNRGAFLRE